MMNCNECMDRIDEFLDNELDTVSRLEFSAHLEGCAECSRELAAIRELREQVASLPRSLDPPRDLWPGISDRLGEAAVVRGHFVRNSLMAAAVVLVLVGSAMTAYFAGRNSALPELALVQTPAAEPKIDLGASFADFGVADFDATRGELLDALEARRHELSPETQQVLEDNLDLIDEAMRRIADALREDPESDLLRKQLVGAYRQQIGLLERAVRMPSDV
jgi:hypothetical protein